MEDVETSLAEIRIFSSVVNRVVVIPESSSILGVGIVVILVLTWSSDIIGPDD